MRPKLPFAPQPFFRIPARGGARLAAVASLLGGVVVAALAPRAIRSAAPRPAEPAAPLAVASGDTQVVYGPSRFDTPTGTPTLHVERFALAVVPGRRYTLRVDNGAPDGSHRVSGGSVTLNGSQILSTADLGSGASGWSRVVQPLSEDTIQVTVQGTAGAYVTASLLSTPDASFFVFGPERFIRPSGAPVTETRHFTISSTAAAPYRMCIVNGNANGTLRISSATIMVNGVSVVTTSELNQHVGGLMKQVTLQRDNTITISLNATPGSFIDLCFNATDVTPPVITIAQPPNHFITRDAQVGVAGSVQDETATTVRVNGQPASMSGASFTATVPLAAEGNNVIHVVATDAAGHSTDSSRTVIHDTQPPVLTLTSPADGLITKDTTATVSGTVTDLTAVTVNVNGIPLPVDSTGAFHGAVALSEGSNILTVTATDAAGNATSQVRTVTRDTHAPVLAVTAPTNGLITNHTPVTVSGSVTDVSAVTVAVNGTPFTVGADGHFTGSVALTEGANTLTTVATDAAGNATTDTRSVTLDTHPPALAVTAPTDGLITKQTPVTVSGTVTDATPVTVDVNGVPLPVDGAGVFTGQVPLAEGANPLTVTAHDAATNTATVVRIVTLDTHAPAIAVTQPADGDIINAASVTTTGTVTDATASTLTVNGNPVPLGSGGAFSVEVPLAPSANTITYAATDAAGNSATTSITVTRRTSNLPPDPVMVASVVNRAEVTTIGANTSFLYSGATPIQTGVAAGTINPVRAAVLRGRVLDKTFAPLGGATVTILGHAELGQTLSREDGGYDLAVNGGGRLTLSFVKDGYFPAQRAADVSWQDYTTLDDVILLQPDPAVTVVDLTSQTPPVARASVVSDADGPRQATLIFKPGNSAILTRADGTQQAITSLSIRATEYTVGDSGELSMPAALPPASQYTYAVQLSADEQLAAGVGAQVTFAQPVPFYVENFLHVPVGTAVPTGGYDAATGTWVPEPNGKVIKVLGKDANGRALVDITGDGQADPPSALAALGIDDYELLQLGGTYPAGSDLWRALAPRLEPEDLNFPFIFVGTTPTDGKVKAGCSSREGDPIRCQLQAQTAFQAVGIVGSPFTLNYASDRTQGNAADRKLDITLTGPTLQAQLLRVELEVDVAGKRFTGSFPPTPNLTYAFSWDGKDIYGRLTQGTQPATVLIGYVFPVQYAAPANATDAFGLPCAPTGTGSACSIISNAQTGARAERTLVQEIETSIGTLDATALGLGGFTLDVQQVYDPVGQVLYKGDGTRRATAALPPAIKTVIGNGDLRPGCSIAEGQSALKSCLGQVGGLAFGPDGSVYLSDIGNGRVRRVTPDGIITTVAGNPNACCVHRDGIPATQAWLGFPAGLAIAPDGSLYIVDRSDNVVRRVAPDGIISTVAGTPGSAGFAGDGGPATQAQLFAPWGLARGPDGSLYVGDRTRVRRIGPDGIIMTVAGQLNSVCDQRSFSTCGDGGPATKALLGFISGDVKVGPDGTLYIMENAFDFKVRRVTPDGIIKAIAGNNNGGDLDTGDGGPATLAALGSPSFLDLGPDGSVYIGEGRGDPTPSQRVRRVTPNGIITTFAGTGVVGFGGDGGPAAAAKLNRTGADAIGVGPDGNVYIPGGSRIRKVAGFLPGFGAGQTVIASPNGKLVYVFSIAGRHLFTLDAVTADTLLRLSYNTSRQLISITDRDGRVTKINRDATGKVMGVVSPDGQSSPFVLDANGDLASVTDPAGDQVQFGYGPGGLLSSVKDARGDSGSYAYDTSGLRTGTTDQAGASATRSMTTSATGEAITMSSPDGITASAGVQLLPTGGSVQTGTLPSGLAMQTTVDAAGNSVTILPDSTRVTMTQSPDPRFGSQAPVTTTITTTPHGLTQTKRTVRTVTLVDSLNPLSVARTTDSIIVNGRVGTKVYTAATRTLTVTSAGGRTTVRRFDPSGRVLSDSVPGLATRTNEYDSQGHLIRVTRGPHLTQYTYGSDGYLAKMTDPTGLVSQFVRDAAGRVTRWVRPDNRPLDFGFDDAGNVTSFTPPGRPAHLIAYTGTNNLSDYIPPTADAVSDPVHRTYNQAGQVVGIAVTGGDSLIMTYDASGRQRSLVLPERTVSFGFSPTAGQLVDVAAPEVDLALSYDGRLLTQTGVRGTVSGSVALTYDNDFRVAARSVNGGSPVALAYDADGLSIGAGALTISRDANTGLVTGTVLGQLTTSQTNDQFGAIAAMSAQYGSSTLYQVTYTRDALDRVTGMSETVGGITTTYGFAYDSVRQLTAVTQNGAPFETAAFDANGNRLTFTTGNGQVSGTYDAQDRLLTYGDATYTYTIDGRLQSKTTTAGATTYRYSLMGDLLGVTLPDGTNIGYLVDGFGRRTGKKVGGALVQGFLYGEARGPVAELDGSNNVLSQFVYGTRDDVPDYMVRGAATYRLVTDHLGSVRLVVDISTGNIAQRIDYDPFGVVVLNTNPGFQPFAFAGGLYDPSTGFVRFGSRDYDAVTGRWTSKDPILVNGGDGNLYRYASGDPVNLTDPVGTAAIQLEFDFALATNAVVDVMAEASADYTAKLIGSTFAGCLGGLASEVVRTAKLNTPLLSCAKGAAVGAGSFVTGGALGALVGEDASLLAELVYQCFNGAVWEGIGDYLDDPTKVKSHLLQNAVFGCGSGMVMGQMNGLNDGEEEFRKLMGYRTNRWYGALVGGLQDALADQTKNLIKSFWPESQTAQTPH